MPVILDAVGVSKSFDTPAGSIDVLSDIGFEVDRGETVAIIGESGSGKSTLLSLLAGLDVPTRGSIRVSRVLAAAKRFGQEHPPARARQPAGRGDGLATLLKQPKHRRPAP